MVTNKQELRELVFNAKEAAKLRLSRGVAEFYIYKWLQGAHNFILDAEPVQLSDTFESPFQVADKNNSLRVSHPGGLNVFRFSNETIIDPSLYQVTRAMFALNSLTHTVNGEGGFVSLTIAQYTPLSIEPALLSYDKIEITDLNTAYLLTTKEGSYTTQRTSVLVSTLTPFLERLVF